MTWGIDGELKRMAVEYSWPDEELRERYDEAVRDCSEWEPSLSPDSDG
jgi:hypothetical protein